MPKETQSSSTMNRETHLPRDLDYITDDLRKRAKSELFEDEDTRVHSLKLFKSMLKDESDLNFQDDDLFLIAFLRARKFDVKKAVTLLKNFYTVRRKHVELYDNFNYDDVRRATESNNIGVLPYRDSEGCIIFVIRLDSWNPHILPLSDVMRALTCGLLQSILSPATQIAGFKVIADFHGFSLMQLPHITPSYLWLFAEALQNVFPGRFRGAHVVNENHLFGYVWVIIKQFLTKKLRDRFHFHGKNVKKLQKYFPPSILTEELGGELPPFDSRGWAAKMEESADYFSHVFSFGFEKRKTKTQEKNSKTPK